MSPCPEPDELERFVAGLGTDLAEHVEHCSRCSAWVREAEADEEMLLAVRRAVSTSGSGEATRDAPARGGAEQSRQEQGRQEQGMPAQLGAYRIGAILGHGGMGVVYEAQQENPRRQVALKVIRPGLTSARMLRRLEHEAEILGRLQHPGVAQIHEAGTFETASGPQPFFAMELVRGEPLIEWARTHGADTRERLELLVEICDAVHHAHTKGVIHRDLKPANILVDDRGRPKVLDFGVARAAAPDDDDPTLQTQEGQIVGTLPYMSPEQLSGRPELVDTRVDVYALGALAYELVAGRVPHDIRNLTITEAIQRISTQEPARLGTIDRRLRGDLETIVATALSTDKDRRYPSASQLARDIDRYLANEPIAARPPTTFYQLRKFAARNRVLVAGVAAVCITLIVGIVGTTTQASRATAAEKKANVRRGEAEKESRTWASVSNLLERVLVQANPELAFAEIDPNPTLRDVLESAAARVTEDLDGEPEVEMRVRVAIGKGLVGVGAHERAVEHLQRALGLAEQLHGPDSSTVAEVLGPLAQAHAHNGKFDDAAAATTRSLDLLRRQESRPKQQIARAELRLAQFFLLATRIGEVAPLLDSAAPVFEQANDYRNMAMLLSVRGGVARAAGDYERAEQALRESIALLRPHLGEHHVSIAKKLRELGRVLRARGKLREAGRTARRAFKAFEKHHGEDHPVTAACLGDVGEIYLAVGNAARAAEVLSRSVEIQRRHLGDSNAALIGPLMMLGLAHIRRQAVDEAEPCFRSAYELAQSELSPDHRDALTAGRYLGKLLTETERAEEALPLLEACLEGSLRTRPLPDIWVAKVETSLGFCLTQLARYERAEGLLLRAWGRLEADPGSEPAVRARYGLQQLYHAWGKPERAAAFR